MGGGVGGRLTVPGVREQGVYPVLQPGGKTGMEEGSWAPMGSITGTLLLLPYAGIQRFCRDIHMMLGFKPGLYFRACWLFLSPATLLVTRGGREGGRLGP